LVIKASAASEIRALIDALGGPDDVMREAAIARLAVIGARGVEKLVAAYDTADAARTREAVLRALEPIGDRRAIEVAQRGMAEGGEVAPAAIAVLRGLLDSRQGDVAAAALDRLVATALDRGAHPRLRLDAFEALQGMPAGIRERVGAALESDPDTKRSLEAVGRPRDAAIEVLWAEACAGRVADDPGAIAAAVQKKAASTALTSLQRMIEGIRAREAAAASDTVRGQWTSLRGALHQSLAKRGSKVAMYDLREALDEASAPLPISFLAALQVLGDVTCLEPIASAYARARQEDSWWRQQLGEAFRAICRRERITKKNAALKRAVSRCPDLASVGPSARTRP
jgi:hypothetical protein